MARLKFSLEYIKPNVLCFFLSIYCTVKHSMGCRIKYAFQLFIIFNVLSTSSMYYRVVQITLIAMLAVVFFFKKQYPILSHIIYYTVTYGHWFFVSHVLKYLHDDFVFSLCQVFF